MVLKKGISWTISMRHLLVIFWTDSLTYLLMSNWLSAPPSASVSLSDNWMICIWYSCFSLSTRLLNCISKENFSWDLAQWIKETVCIGQYGTLMVCYVYSNYPYFQSTYLLGVSYWTRQTVHISKKNPSILDCRKLEYHWTNFLLQLVIEYLTLWRPSGGSNMNDNWLLVNNIVVRARNIKALPFALTDSVRIF